MASKPTRRAFLGALGAAPLARAAFWDKKSFPDWNEAEIDKMLTDSPWAKSMTARFQLSDPREVPRFDYSVIGLPSGIQFPRIPGGGPSQSGGSPYPGGGGQPTSRGEPVTSEAYLTIRWSSALPIKQAILLDRYGKSAATEPDAARALNREEPDYVIEIFGLPAMVVHDGPERLEADILANSALTRKSGSGIRPTSVNVPAHGEHLSISIRFPRTDPIRLEDKQIEFRAQAASIEFKRKFKLPHMLYQSHLEL